MSWTGSIRKRDIVVKDLAAETPLFSVKAGAIPRPETNLTWESESMGSRKLDIIVVVVLFLAMVSLMIAAGLVVGVIVMR
jgi:hypothetical protein